MGASGAVALESMCGVCFEERQKARKGEFDNWKRKSPKRSRRWKEALLCQTQVICFSAMMPSP